MEPEISGRGIGGVRSVVKVMEIRGHKAGEGFVNHRRLVFREQWIEA